VEDVVAETLKRVFVRFPRWPAWNEVWAWASRVARNLLVSEVRSRRRRRSAPLDEHAGAMFSPDRSLARACAKEALAAVRARACQGDRETLDLLAIGVSDHRQIAALRGVSPRSVRAAMHRLRGHARRFSAVLPLDASAAFFF